MSGGLYVLKSLYRVFPLTESPNLPSKVVALGVLKLRLPKVLLRSSIYVAFGGHAFIGIQCKQKLLTKNSWIVVLALCRVE